MGKCVPIECVRIIQEYQQIESKAIFIDWSEKN